MVTVKFHGNLKRFESEQPITLKVKHFGELMSGLLTQIQGLREQLRQGYYKVRIGKTYLSQSQLEQNPTQQLSEDCTVHFTPVIKGAGKNVGAFQIVVGIALIVSAFYTGGASLSAWGPGATMMGTMGASMLLGGVMSFLTKPPEMNTKLGDSEKQQSTAFSNLQNLTPQGRPIPLLYGKMMTSLILVSQGVETFDEVIENKKK